MTLHPPRQADRAGRVEVRKWFKTLSDLRGKERSLLHGGYTTLAAGPGALAYLRLWDQSDRYLVAANWGAAAVTLTLKSTGTTPVSQSSAGSVCVFSCS